jgi:collagenase-like PrtC family protease
MPPPVAMLLEQKYVKGIDMDQIEARDVAILRYLKQKHPDLYATLNKAVGNTNKRSTAAS